MAATKQQAPENLVIVESPAKAKTIEGFLGKEFLVKSSYGHIRDLPESGQGIDLENNFQPNYVIPEEKKKVVDELKKAAKKAKAVWLATDEDREGEAISWHLAETLGLDIEKTKRIVFHEITKSAILEAIENPRVIDMKLVNAQQARRVLDRLVGFELSPVLWKKVKPSLSAGRVQSVAVRLLVEREREVFAFKAESAFKVMGLFTVDGATQMIRAELAKRLPNHSSAKSLLQSLTGASFSVGNLEVKPAAKSPSAPFTTSTLQQEASRKLGYSVQQTMIIAQQLYEAGKISYMRTDSVNLSDFAMKAAKEVITKTFGPDFSNTRTYKNKAAKAQEAHEAIRPTNFEVKNPGMEDDRQNRLYELIWKRAIASQMANAELERTIVTIQNNQSTDTFTATGEVIRFEGFLKVYMESEDEETNVDDLTQEGMLPKMEIGQALGMKEIRATERFSLPPPRYTEASLVKKMEALGIGRPSTYAPTISVIQRRGYVEKESREGRERNFSLLILKGNIIEESTETEITGAEKFKLFPTDIGMVVTDFLIENFKNVLDFNFTARVEEEFDEIALGKVKWTSMIGDFYTPFHKDVEQTTKESARAAGDRELGIDPASGKKLIVRIGRYGPMAQIGSTDEEEKPRFAKLKPGQRIETITIEQALDLFKLPRTIGNHEEEDIVASIGRFGPYLRFKGAFYSIPKTDDPYTIDLPRALEVIAEKQKAAAEKIIKTFQENPQVSIQKGRWGPFLKFEDKIINIPKKTDPASLTFAECEELAKTFVPKEKKGKKKK